MSQNNLTLSNPSLTEPLALKPPEKIKSTFLQFRKYCLSILHSLNDHEGYSCSYKKQNHPLLKEHDA
jgi:hypothetical protein